MADEASYLFLNGCDGGLIGGLSIYDSYGEDMTEAEAKARACELAQDNPGFLVSAVRIAEPLFVVQKLNHVFVDRDANRIPDAKLPEDWRLLTGDTPTAPSP